MSKIQVEVTSKDIARGRRHDPYYCPVTRALQRACGRPCFRRAAAFYAGYSLLIGIYNGRAFSHVPYPRVRDFMLSFDYPDQYRKAKPFRFVLNVR